MNDRIIPDKFEVEYEELTFEVYGEYEKATPRTPHYPGDPATFDVTGVYLKDDPHERDLREVLEVDVLTHLEDEILARIEAEDDGDDLDGEDDDE